MTKEEQIEAAWKAHTETEAEIRIRIRAKKVEEQSRRCYYCMKEFTSENKPTLDHVIPRSAGGTDDEANLVAACRGCNHKKDSGSVEVFIKKLNRNIRPCLTCDGKKTIVKKFRIDCPSCDGKGYHETIPAKAVP